MQNVIHIGECLRGDFDKVSVSLDSNQGLLIGFLFSEAFSNCEAGVCSVEGKTCIHLFYLPVPLELASLQDLTGISSMNLLRT